MGKYVDYYCKDNNKELKKIVEPILIKNFGWLPQKDYDDFFSIAAQVVWDCEKSFDESKVKTNKFESYLKNCILNKVKTHLTYMHRNKRVLKDKDGNPVYDVSLDFQIDEDEKITIGDMISSDQDVESELNIGYEDKIEKFLESLPETAKNIAFNIMNGLSPAEIKERMKLTDKQYQEQWKIITSYDKKRMLYDDKNLNENVEVEKMESKNFEDVSEKYKNTSYSIESISKQLRKKRIRDDHILQRYSGQWKGFAKSDLVSCVLRGKSLTQIIISEEFKNGLRMQWLIDGKQRCTTLDDYLHDGFAISKNIKNYMIQYQTTKLDEDGNEVLNEDGFTEIEVKEFDIRGKKFSQLPEELQEIYKDRQIPVLYNMNCTKKDIADDIARFNRSRPMNKAQNGWLGLDEVFAEFVENIARMPFFQPDFKGSTYTNTNFTSGSIRRIIVESIMVSDFLEDYCKDFNKICEYLTDEASDSNFTEFYSLVERLTAICNESVANKFNAKDSFLWFGLFSRFVNYGVEDSKFIDFMIEFDKSLTTKEIDGVTYESLNGTSTKDKNVVHKKILHMEALLKDFLHISENDNEAIDDLTFVRENVKPDVTSDELSDYEEDLSILTLDVDNDSKLLNKENHQSLIAIIAYSYLKDIPIDQWFVEYFSNNNTYNRNQKLNYIHMRDDLNAFIKKGKVA